MTDLDVCDLRKEVDQFLVQQGSAEPGIGFAKRDAATEEYASSIGRCTIVVDKLS